MLYLQFIFAKYYKLILSIMYSEHFLDITNRDINIHEKKDLTLHFILYNAM